MVISKKKKDFENVHSKLALHIQLTKEQSSSLILYIILRVEIFRLQLQLTNCEQLWKRMVSNNYHSVSFTRVFEINGNPRQRFVIFILSILRLIRYYFFIFHFSYFLKLSYVIVIGIHLLILSKINVKIIFPIVNNSCFKLQSIWWRDNLTK